VSDENIERICRVSDCGPGKSTRAAVGELQIPQSTAHRVSQKRLCLYSYKLQVVQVIMPDYTVASKKSAVTMLEKLDEDSEFCVKSCSMTRLHSMFQGR
jgi:hypothetical protein